MNIHRKEMLGGDVVFIGPIVIRVESPTVEAILSGESIFKSQAENFEDAVDAVLQEVRKQILAA